MRIASTATRARARPGPASEVSVAAALAASPAGPPTPGSIPKQRLLAESRSLICAKVIQLTRLSQVQALALCTVVTHPERQTGAAGG